MNATTYPTMSEIMSLNLKEKSAHADAICVANVNNSDFWQEQFAIEPNFTKFNATSVANLAFISKNCKSRKIVDMVDDILADFTVFYMEKRHVLVKTILSGAKEMGLDIETAPRHIQNLAPHVFDFLCDSFKITSLSVDEIIQAANEFLQGIGFCYSQAMIVNHQTVSPTKNQTDC